MTSTKTVTIEINSTDQCWSPEFKAKVEMLENRINGYVFGDMPSSFTEIYRILKVWKKEYKHFEGKKCYKWIDNDSAGIKHNAERCATIYDA